jgi:hypothetical protein
MVGISGILAVGKGMSGKGILRQFIPLPNIPLPPICNIDGFVSAPEREGNTNKR